MIIRPPRRGHRRRAAVLPLVAVAVAAPAMLQFAARAAAAVPVVPVTALQIERRADLKPSERSQLSFRAATGATPPPGAVLIRVDDSRRRQPIWGVGAALTNASSELIEHDLVGPTRRALVANLFGPAGAGLAFVRVTVGGSDFNAGGRRYSEDDMPGRADPALRHFSLAHDRDTIAVLRQALSANPHIRVLASPWSAPAWMKTNDSLQDVGFTGHLEPRYYGSYARYLVKFVQGYRRAGVPIWGLTVQNEPFGVPASYEGMELPPASEARLVDHYLRPALRRADLAPKIYALDASWDGVPYARTALRAPSGFAGVAWHCYNGNPDTAMSQFAAHSQILSECAPNLISALDPALFADVFDDGASAAALWNVALDPAGGPVVAPNQSCHGCRGVVTIDPRTGSVRYGRTSSISGSSVTSWLPGRCGSTRRESATSTRTGPIAPAPTCTRSRFATPAASTCSWWPTTPPSPAHSLCAGGGDRSRTACRPTRR